MKKNMSILLLCILILNLLNACQKEELESNKLHVAVSITPVEGFVKAIAGDNVDVITLIPPGESPANFQPTINQMSNISEAKVYFSIGVPTEKANINSRIKDLNKDIKVVKLDDIVDSVYPALYLNDDNSIKRCRDPHIWMSPKRVIVIVEQICNELINLDPENKDIYKVNASNYIEKIKEIDNELKITTKNLDNKTIITIHPSLGYFADEYGLEIITLEKDGKEYTASRLENIIDFAKENQITTVLYQAEFDNQKAKILASEIDGDIIEICPLAADYIRNLADINEMLKSVMQ